MKDGTTASSTPRELQTTRRQRHSLLTLLHKKPDTRHSLRQEQIALQRQVQRLRKYRLLLQLQVNLDRILAEGGKDHS